MGYVGTVEQNVLGYPSDVFLLLNDQGVSGQNLVFVKERGQRKIELWLHGCFQ